MSAPQASLPLALTQGDPSGIGPEIAIKAWLARSATTPPWFLLADPNHIARVAKQIGVALPIAVVEPEAAAAAFATSLPISIARAFITPATQSGSVNWQNAAGIQARCDP